MAADRDGAEWWWVCTDFFRHGGKVVAGPFADRDLALRFRTYYEAHPDAKGRTFAIDAGPLTGRSPEASSEVPGG